MEELRAVIDDDFTVPVRWIVKYLISNEECLLGFGRVNEWSFPLMSSRPHTNRAYVFNRYANCWLPPVRLPPPYNTCASFQLLQFASRRTFYVSFTDAAGAQILALLRISDDFGAIEERKRLTLRHAASDRFHCLAFHRTPAGALLLCEHSPHEVAVYEVRAENARVMASFRVDAEMLYCNALVHDGEIYVSALDLRVSSGQFHIYRVVVANDRQQLEFVSDYDLCTLEVSDYYRQYLSSYITCDGTDILIVTFVSNTRQASTAAFNVVTKQWSIRQIRYDVPLVVANGTPDTKTGFLSSELFVMVAVESWRFLYDLIFPRHLLVFWTRPPKLRAVALKALHRGIPPNTKAALAERPSSINSIGRLAHFLYTARIPDRKPKGYGSYVWCTVLFLFVYLFMKIAYSSPKYEVFVIVP